MNRFKEPSARSIRRISKAQSIIRHLDGFDVATADGGTNWRGPGEELHLRNERFGDQSAVRSDHWPVTERWSPQDNFPSGGFGDAFGWDMRVGGHYSHRDPDPEIAWNLDRDDVFFGEEFGAGPLKEMRSVTTTGHKTLADEAPAHQARRAPSAPGAPARIERGNVGRSDARIREEIAAQLTGLDDVDAGDITVVVADGEVSLAGTTVDLLTKFRVERLCEKVAGVREVSNALRIRRHATSRIGSH